jgi:zinc protease
MLELRFLLSTSTYIEKAEALIRGEASAGNFRTTLDYRELVRAVRAEDVQRVASESFHLANMSVHEFESRGAPARSFDAERYAATVTAWAPSFPKPVDPKTVQTSSASLPPVLPQGSDRTAQQQMALESIEAVAVKDFSTLNGPRALVREDHSQQLVNVLVLFQGGRAIEDQGNSGITELMLRSLLYGTSSRTASDVAFELEQLGADVKIVAELDFYGFSMNALSRNVERALKLLATVIEQPAFREDDVTRARQEQLALVQQAGDIASERSFALLMQSLVPSHPYSLPKRGLEEAITKLTPEQLREWHEKTIKRQLPLAIIVGDTDGSALVSGQMVEAFRRRDVDRAIQVKVPQSAKPADKTEARNIPISLSAIGYPGAKGDAADIAIIAALEAHLFDGSQRIGDTTGAPIHGYGELRQESLLVAGVLYVQLLTSPSMESGARSWLIGRLERAARGEIAAPEFSWAVTVASIKTLWSLQHQETRAFEYARALLYGRQPADVDTIHNSLSKLSIDDVKRVAGQYIKPGGVFAGVVRGRQAVQSNSPAKQN